MADVRVSVPASAIRRLRIAALDYMRRTGASDPGLLERVDELWSDGSSQRTHLSIAEMAARVGRSERTVRRWIAAGSITGVKVGGSVLIPVEELAALGQGHGSPDATPVD